MPGQAVIGKVAVKVVPDTTGFRREAQRKLDALERGLKVTVGTKLDTSGLSRDMLEAVRTINQRNRNNDSRKIRFHATISTDGMREAVVQARRRLQERADNERISFRIQDLEVANARLVLDQNSLDRVKRQIEDWRRDNSPVEVPVELDLRGYGIASARLALLTRPRRVEIIPHLNGTALAGVEAGLLRLSGARVIADSFRDMGRYLADMDKHAAGLATIATGIAGIAAVGLTSASNIAALAGSLASIAPAALALPGILGGVAIGTGVMVAALKDFNKVFPDVKQAFSEMQDLISANFFEQAEAPLRRMLDDILPRLSSGFAETATALGGFFGGLADGVRTTLATKLDSMFADLAESIKIATTGTQAFVGIITTLGQVGAGYLPRLAQWFVDISERFNNFLTDAAADGRLQAWIDSGITALKDLGSVLGSLGSIFYSVFRAAEAAGGSTLAVLANSLERVARAAESPAFQTTLTGALAAAHRAFDNLFASAGPGFKTFLSGLANAAQSILPVVGTTIGTLVGSITSALSNQDVMDSLISFFLSIRTAVVELTPLMPPLAAAFATVLDVLGTFASTVAPTVTAVFSALALTLASLGPTIETLVVALGEGLMTVVSAFLPLLEPLASAFKSVLETVTPLAPLFADVLATAIETISPLVGPLADQFVLLVKTLKPLSETVLKKVKDALEALGPVFDFIGRKMTEHADLINVVLIAALVKMGVTATIQFAKVVAGWVAAAAAAVVAVATSLLRMYVLIAQFVILGSAATAQAARVVAAWVLMAARAVASVAVTVAQIAIAIARWTAMAVAAGIQAARVAAAWLLAGVTSVATAVASTVVGVATMVARWVFLGAQALAQGARVAAAWLLALGPIGIVIAAVAAAVILIVRNWDKIKAAFQKGVEAVLNFVRPLPGKIAEFFGNAGSLLIGAGRKIIDGLISGIKSAFGRVRSTLSSLTSMLPDWKGPATRDATLLKDAGKLVMDGFINGLESRYRAVKDSLGGLSDDISGTQFGIPSVKGGAGAGLAGRINNSLADGGIASQNVLNYYAAAGASFGAEEDLFAAASRTRMVGW